MKVILLILAAFFLVGIVRVGLFVLRIRKQMKHPGIGIYTPVFVRV